MILLWVMLTAIVTLKDALDSADKIWHHPIRPSELQGPYARSGFNFRTLNWNCDDTKRIQTLSWPTWIKKQRFWGQSFVFRECRYDVNVVTKLSTPSNHALNVRRTFIVKTIDSAINQYSSVANLLQVYLVTRTSSLFLGRFMINTTRWITWMTSH